MTYYHQAGFAAALLLLTHAEPAVAQSVTVEIDRSRQSIRGYGGMNHPQWAGDLTAAQRETAFGNGPDQMGMTILRMHVDENSNNWSREVDTARAALEHGAIVFASPWNPPTSMRVVVNGQRRLDPNRYAAYRDHLNAFVQSMESSGIELYAISVQNEPDYAAEWTEWSAEELASFVKDFGDSIQTRVIAPESFQYRKVLSDPILNDPAALANLDILGAHIYGTQVDQLPYPLFDEKAEHRERWMTEVYTDSKNDADLWPMALDVAYSIHNSMVEAEFNAYVWWYIRRSYGMIKENGQISKRGHCMSHYSKFVRPGYKRVEATKNPMQNVYVSAYNGDDQVVVVLINRGDSPESVDLSFPGAGLRSLNSYITSSSKNLVDEGKLDVSSGTVSVNLVSQSVTTLVGLVDVPVEDSGGASAGDAGDAGNFEGVGGNSSLRDGGAIQNGGTPDVVGGSFSESGGDSATLSGGALASGGRDPFIEAPIDSDADENIGCGCRSAGGRGSAGAPLFALLFWVLAFRRRSYSTVARLPGLVDEQVFGRNLD